MKVINKQQILYPNKKINKYIQKYDIIKIQNSFLLLNQLQFNSVNKVKELSINHCNLDILYHIDFSNLQKLEKLDLSFNNLKHIPLKLHLIPNLHTIILHHNDISLIPNHISKINTLKYIDLSFNEIHTFNINSIPIYIEYINLSNNHFYHIELTIDKNIFNDINQFIINNCNIFKNITIINPQKKPIIIESGNTQINELIVL